MAHLQPRRLLIQYLEPSPAVDALTPSEARDHLARAFDQLPVTDLALGWRLRPTLVSAVRSVVPSDVTVWRWVPVFVDSGEGRAVDPLVAVGPGGTPPPPFGDMADFRFLCLDQDEVVEAGLSRAIELAREIEADGVLLDRIRWHSPSPDPAAELSCFCETSRQAAAQAGLDLAQVAAAVTAMADTLVGRRALVSALLGRAADGPLRDFLDRRAGTVTRAVEWLASGLQDAALRAALDVFTPALTRSVGQDPGALGPLGEWSKSMTYFEALGPASMPFELAGYGRWLKAAGEKDAAGFLADLLGFPAPGSGGHGAQSDALNQETTKLIETIGLARSVVGLDAVEIPGVCEVDDDDLDARVRSLRRSGVGASPCWELLFIDEQRTKLIAEAWDDRE